ncbi:MAG: hypothetical protein E7319_09430 [Clostridiales bacterium]|nr:hypothetical protein [Clostridiales bacterium]
MRTLKIIAIVSVALLLVMLLMLWYLFLSAEVTVSVTSSQGVSAADVADFESTKTALNDGTFLGTTYHKPTQWKDATEYVYLTYTIHLKNGCLVPIDMIEVQVVPQPDDIAQIGDFRAVSLNAKSEGDLTTTILVPKDTHPVREMIVSYYVWGVSFQVKTISQ